MSAGVIAPATVSTKTTDPRSTAWHGMAWRATRARWLKFNLVGAIGIGVQLGTLLALRSVLHLGYLLATALAVEAAVIHNFVWHERFTWADRASLGLRQSLWRLLKFNCTTGAVSIGGNLLLMRLLVGEWHLHYLLANVVTIVCCSLLNFVISDWVVFRREVHRGRPQRVSRFAFRVSRFKFRVRRSRSWNARLQRTLATTPPCRAAGPKCKDANT